MELRHLKLVEAVAEEGTLTGAGRKLFLTQSALSHQLKELEEQLGVKLFQRVKKKMVLTPAGIRLLRTAHNVLSELEKTEQEIREYVNGEAGLIRLSTECYTCYHWLPRILKSYSRRFPGVEVRIVAEATRQPQKYLLEGELDVAIVSCLTRGNEKSGLRFTELFSDELVVVAHSGHRFAARSEIAPEDFSDEHLICYSAPLEHLDVYQRLLLPAGVMPKKTSHIELTEAIVEMVKADMGVSVMASWAMKPYLKSKELISVPVANRALQRTWYAVVTDHGSSLHYVERFIRHMKKTRLG